MFPLRHFCATTEVKIRGLKGGVKALVKDILRKVMDTVMHIKRERKMTVGKKYIPILLIMGGAFLGGNAKADVTLGCHFIEKEDFEKAHNHCHGACGNYAQQKGWRKWKSTFEKMDPQDKLFQRCPITNEDIEKLKKIKDSSIRACVCKKTTEERNTREIPLKTIQKNK